MISFVFQDKKLKAIKDLLQNKYLLVLSLVMLYHNRNTVVYKVIGCVIYSFIDNSICLDYLGILQYKLSAYDNKFEKRSSINCLAWVFLEF